MVAADRKRRFTALPLLVMVALIPLPSMSEGSARPIPPHVDNAGHLRDASQNNLKQLGLVLAIFASEDKGGLWPSLSERPGHLFMRAAAIYPEYLDDPLLCISPAHPKVETLLQKAAQDPASVIDDHSYWYLGYAISEDKAGLALVTAYKESVKNGGVPQEDINDADAGLIPRLREGVERLFISDINNPHAAADAQARIPVLIERPGLQKGGSSVLFMDGHIEFIEYPGKFPMTEQFIEALLSIDELKKVEEVKGT